MSLDDGSSSMRSVLSREEACSMVPSSSSVEAFLSFSSSSEESEGAEAVDVLCCEAVVKLPAIPVSKVEPRESRLLALLQKSFLIAAQTGDFATVELIADIGKLQPLFHDALMSAIENHHEDVALLIASHPSCQPTLNNYEAVELAVANKMDVELIMKLLRNSNRSAGRHFSIDEIYCKDETIEKAIELCIVKGLVNVLSYLAAYYEHPRTVLKNGVLGYDKNAAPQIFSKLLNAACNCPFALQTVPIIVTTKNPFCRGVKVEFKLHLLQHFILDAHKNGRKAVRNLLIKRALMSYKKHKSHRGSNNTTFPYLAQILDASESIQYMIANDTGYNYLPNELKREIFDTMIDKVIEEQVTKLNTKRRRIHRHNAMCWGHRNQQNHQ